MALSHSRKNLRTVVGSRAGPYGYTLATWTTGAVLTNIRGIPDSLSTLAFMAGAVLGFVFIAALAFGDVTKHFDQKQGRSLLWGSFHFSPWGSRLG